MMSALLSVTAFTSCTTNDHAKVAKVEAAESSAGFLLPIVFAIATARSHKKYDTTICRLAHL